MTSNLSGLETGDIVRVVGSNEWPDGLIGTVILPRISRPLIEFDAKEAAGRGHDGYGNHARFISPRNCWFVFNKHLVTVGGPW